MSYALVIGPCIACARVFAFNPHHVPSSSAVTGEREPICAACVVRINANRYERGLEPIVPHPDAYAPEDVDA